LKIRIDDAKTKRTLISFKNKKEKEREIAVSLFYFYGFFLSKSKPTMAIAIIIAMTAKAIPIVRPDIVASRETGEAVGAVVAGAEPT
jgi:hypothetical protein